MLVDLGFNSFIDIIQMQRRKGWTEEQDRILKYLKEEREEKKWSNIAKFMETEFNIPGKTSKQCRQRYHNHLDASISTDSWKQEQDQILIQVHQQIGNKWSIISQHLPGRTDNCVKNHFYSKLRKSVRKLNKIISEYFNQDFLEIKQKLLSKIIQTQESRFNLTSKVDEQMADFCNNIKNSLFALGAQPQQLEQDVQKLQQARRLIIDIQIFENNYKKGYRAIKKCEQALQRNPFLKPPSTKIKRSNSGESFKSEDSSFLSSSSCISSCSDISEYDQIDDDNKKSKTASSRKARKGSYNRQEDFKNQKMEDIYHFQQQNNDNRHNRNEGMKTQQFQKQHQILIQEESNQIKINQYEKELYLDNIMYDNTPMTARILAPAEVNMNVTQFPLFSSNNDNDDEIQYKQERQA